MELWLECVCSETGSNGRCSYTQMTTDITYGQGFSWPGQLLQRFSMSILNWHIIWRTSSPYELYAEFRDSPYNFPLDCRPFNLADEVLCQQVPPPPPPIIAGCLTPVIRQHSLHLSLDFTCCFIQRFSLGCLHYVESIAMARVYLLTPRC